MKKLTISDHLTLSQIDDKLKKCSDPKEVVKWLAIRIMKKEGLSANQAAKVLGFSHGTVRSWANNYNDYGESGLIDKRKYNKRGNTFRDSNFLARLGKILDSKPDKGGVWLGRLVQAWVYEEYNLKFPLGTIYRWMHEAGYDPKVPRPHHIKSSPEECIEFKKKISNDI